MLVLLQVILRYGFNFTPFFTEEIGRYALVCGTLLGASASIRDNAHIRVTFLQEILTAKMYWFIQFFIELISLLVFIILSWASFASVDFARGQTSAGLQIPLEYPYLILPISFGCALVFILYRLNITWQHRPWQQYYNITTSDTV